MKQVLKYLFLSLTAFLPGCKEALVNPDAPHAYINFEINLNQADYYELNFSSNFVYVTSDPDSQSRGIIVYRMPTIEPEFRVYDRFPPNYPYACCDDNGHCKRLSVAEDGIRIVDSCSSITYNILDGSVLEGEGRFELIQYRWSYNMNYNTLHVYN